MGNDFIVMIHCLTYLAVHDLQRFSSQQLAENACANAVVVRRLMSLAATEGYISVTVGPKGGYQIKSAPEDISLGKLFVLVHEDERLKKQFKDTYNQTCLVASNMSSVLGKFQEEQLLEQVRFYDRKSIATVMDAIQQQAETDEK